VEVVFEKSKLNAIMIASLSHGSHNVPELLSADATRLVAVVHLEGLNHQADLKRDVSNV
jgi:hypothetical protein